MAIGSARLAPADAPPRLSRGRLPVELLTQARTWGRVLAAAGGLAAFAGACQLGVAYGLGLVRLGREFPADGLWSAQLTWVAWCATLAVLSGAVGGDWLARQRELTTQLAARVLLAVAAGLGAALVVWLTALSARAAVLTGRGAASAPLEASLAALLGIVVGILAAVLVLTVRLAALSVTMLVGLVWLVALVSVAPSLPAGAALPEVRLGVLDLLSFDGARSLIAVLSPPVLALAVCGAVAFAARSRGLPPLPTAAATAAAPGLLALAYLIGSPGIEQRSVQTSPYAGALIAVAAGLLASLLVGIVKLPGTGTAGPESFPGEPGTVPYPGGPGLAGGSTEEIPAVGGTPEVTGDRLDGYGFAGSGSTGSDGTGSGTAGAGGSGVGTPDAPDVSGTRGPGPGGAASTGVVAGGPAADGPATADPAGGTARWPPLSTPPLSTPPPSPPPPDTGGTASAAAPPPPVPSWPPPAQTGDDPSRSYAGPSESTPDGRSGSRPAPRVEPPSWAQAPPMFDPPAAPPAPPPYESRYAPEAASATPYVAGESRYAPDPSGTDEYPTVRPATADPAPSGPALAAEHPHDSHHSRGSASAPVTDPGTDPGTGPAAAPAGKRRRWLSRRRKQADPAGGAAEIATAEAAAAPEQVPEPAEPESEPTEPVEARSGSAWSGTAGAGDQPAAPSDLPEPAANNPAGKEPAGQEAVGQEPESGRSRRGGRLRRSRRSGDEPAAEPAPESAAPVVGPPEPEPAAAPPDEPAPGSTAAGRRGRRGDDEHIDWISSLAGKDEEEEDPGRVRRRLRRGDRGSGPSGEVG